MKKVSPRFFEVDEGHVVVAALSALARKGRLDPEVAEGAMRDYGIQKERVDIALP